LSLAPYLDAEYREMIAERVKIGPPT
jgi:hypothetical protein